MSLTHIPFKPWCTSCVKGKAQTELRKRIERIAEDSELPIVQCDYIVLKDDAYSDLLRVLRMYVKSIGYGTSIVDETERCNRHVRSDMGNEDVELSWTPRHHFAMRSRTITH